MGLSLNDKWIVFVINFVIEHVIIEDLKLIIVVFEFINGIDLLAVISLINNLVNASIRNISMSVDFPHVLLKSASHGILRLLPYVAQGIAIVVP